MVPFQQLITQKKIQWLDSLNQYKLKTGSLNTDASELESKTSSRYKLKLNKKKYFHPGKKLEKLEEKKADIWEYWPNNFKVNELWATVILQVFVFIEKEFY